MSAPDSLLQDALRRQLIVALGAFSEQNYAAGWQSGIDQIAYRQGGDWEVIGREIGWPLGYEASEGWVSWDAAGIHYDDLGRS